MPDRTLGDLAQALAHHSGPQLAAEVVQAGAEESQGSAFGEAVAVLRQLAKGLDYEANPRVAARLLRERIAARRDAEALQAGLSELGARLLLHRLTREDV